MTGDRHSRQQRRHLRGQTVLRDRRRRLEAVLRDQRDERRAVVTSHTGVKQEGLPVVRDRFVPLSQLLEDFRSGLNSTGIIGRQRHGLVSIGQTLSVPPRQMVIPGAVVVANSIIRLKLDQSLVTDGF